MLRREKDHYCQLWHFGKLARRSLVSLKLWVDMRKVPNYYHFYPACVWILYELLVYCDANKKQNSMISLSVKSPGGRYSIHSRRVSQDSKIQDMSFSEKLEEFPFSKQSYLRIIKLVLPQYFQLSNKKRYLQIHTESNRALNQFFMKKIFESWKNNSRAIIDFKRRRLNGFMAPYFKSWRNYTTRKVINAFKINKHHLKWHKPITNKLFQAWAKYSKKKRTLRRLYKNTVSSKEEFILSQCFHHWNNISHINMTVRERTSIAETYRESKTLEKAFHGWAKYTTRMNKVANIFIK